MTILLLLVSLILRLIGISQSLWLDEAVQAVTARQDFSYIFTEIVGDFHPPLYHFLMHFWVGIFGDSEIALRMPSVLFGVGTVFVVYKIASRFQNKQRAVLLMALLATAPFHIYYSQEARMYAMAAFLTALSFYFFMKLLIFDKENQKSKIKNQRQTLKLKNINYIFYFIATLLLIYTDYYGFLVLLAQMIYLAINKRFKFMIQNSLFMILCYLPWVPMLVLQIKTGMSATQTLPGWANLVNVSFWKAIPLTLVKFTIGRITVFNKTIYGVISGIIIFFSGFIIAKGYFKKKKLPISDYQLVIGLWFLVPLLVSWLVSWWVPNFQPFRLLLILPAYYLLLAEGIAGINNKKIQFLVIGLWLIINLVCLSVYYGNPYFKREDWRGIVNYLQMQNTVVILPSETSSWPIQYYDPDSSINMIYASRGINKIEELTGYGLPAYENTKIFYICYLSGLFDPGEQILAKLNAEGYTKVREISFNQILVWEFKLTD